MVQVKLTENQYIHYFLTYI